VSQFVNYSKRGVELPEGCKDLIDVLQMAGQESVAEPDRVAIEGLAHIEVTCPGCWRLEPSRRF
jgi:hypothetical protein